MKIKDYRPELFNIGESIINQSKVWQNGNPKFAPPDGTCWYCRFNIYVPRFWKYRGFGKIETSKDTAEFVTGVTIEKSKNLITSCPHCNRSYCD